MNMIWTKTFFNCVYCYSLPAADIMLDVTFNAVTLSEYQNDVPAFQNTVTEMVSVKINLLES